MRLRAPVPDDAAAVAALLAARDVADLGRSDHNLRGVRGDWAAAGFDLAADAIVAERDDGRIVGYVALRDDWTLAAVAPECERQGIGARLLRWAELRERERTRGRTHHRQTIAAANQRGAGLLTANGYEYERSYFRMVRTLPAPAPSAPPPGVTLRALDPARDAEALHAVDAAGFAGVPDYRAETLAAFRAEHLDIENLDLEVSAVAAEGESVAGFLVARRWSHEPAVYVELLAVDPARQRRGIGRALVTNAFARAADAGLAEVSLGVASDNPPALALYERLGMVSRFTADSYARPIGSRPAAR